MKRAGLLQPWLFEEAVAVGGFDAKPCVATVAQYPDRDLRSSGTGAPHLAVKIGKAVNLLIPDVRDDVAAPQTCLSSWPPFGDAHYHHLASALGSEHPEPRPRRRAALASGEKIIKNGRQ